MEIVGVLMPSLWQGTNELVGDVVVSSLKEGDTRMHSSASKTINFYLPALALSSY